MRNPLKVVRDWSVLRAEKAGLLAHIQQSGTRCGISVPLRDLGAAKDEAERERWRELNEITKTAASQLIMGELADKYDLNDHGLSLSFVPKIVMDRTVSKGMIDTFRERGGILDAASLARYGFKPGELPDHAFRDLDVNALNGDRENVWEKEDREREARRAARSMNPKAKPPRSVGGLEAAATRELSGDFALVDADGSPIISTPKSEE